MGEEEAVWERKEGGRFLSLTETDELQATKQGVVFGVF